MQQERAVLEAVNHPFIVTLRCAFQVDNTNMNSQEPGNTRVHEQP